MVGERESEIHLRGLEPSRNEKTQIQNLTPNIQKHPTPLLHMLNLRMPSLDVPALRLAQYPRKDVLHSLAHALRVTADVHVPLRVPDHLLDLLPVLPEQILHVDLAPIRLARTRT